MMERRPSTQNTTRFLVTGGSGFVGGHIVSQLLASDESISVAILSRRPKQTKDRVTYHAADIASEAEVRAVFDEIKPHVVIHTASPRLTEDEDVLYRTNVEGTKILLKVARFYSETKAFVYTSSDSALVPTQEPLKEEDAELYTETNYTSTYALSKALADAMVLKTNDEHIRTAVIRIPMVYGENDPNLAPQLIASVRKNEHKMQVGDNKKVFEYVYVGKAAEAHILAARALMGTDFERVAGEAFFISDGVRLPYFDFARKCYAAIGSPVKPEDVTTIPLAAMQAMASTGEWASKIFTFGMKKPVLRRIEINYLDRGSCWSIEKAKEKLRFEPIADQDAAIKKTMEWAQANAEK